MVESSLHNLIAAVATHPSWAYATVFLAALLEALPVAGSFVPGSTVILGLSAIIATGGLKLPEVLACAVTGAIIGDGAAFWLGHREKQEILETWPLSDYPKVIARSTQFFQRYGTLAVFLARFVAPVRAFVPVTAGALGMPPHRFFPVNVVAILLWAPAHVLPGMFAGTALRQWGSTIHHYMAAFALAAIALGVVGWAVWQHLQRHNLGAPARDPNPSA